MRFEVLVLFPLILLPLSLRASAEECGMEAKVGGIRNIIPKETFEEMLSQKDDPRCHAVGFYTYDAFIAAAKVFPKFGNTGNATIRKREIAAFFGQTSHETTGGWPSSIPPPDHWGYCYVEQIDKKTCCRRSVQYDCCPKKPGLKFYGRGPIQITWNYNYGLCGKDLWNDVNYLQCNPDLVARNATVSFMTAIWFWMTPQNDKPSSHAVITDNWKPTPQDIEAKRCPGYGVITNIINGGVECGQGKNDAGEDRIRFYKRYCNMFGVSSGENLDCYNQRPFGTGGSLKMVV